MAVTNVWSGNRAIAEAVRQVCPDVVAGYPIAPSSSIFETLASFVSDGRMDMEMIASESDHSAMSACIGASAAGARTFSATASQGLAFMHEVLFIASSLRLPIVCAVTNRALSTPLNIHADHSDTFAQRDCGWIQLYSETPQEAYDNMIQAFKIAEQTDVKLPIMVGLDGFITSHIMTGMVSEETSDVADFVGKYSPSFSLLDVERPATVGSVDSPHYYFEHKAHQAQGMEIARKAIKTVGKEFGHRFGRYYGLFESYKLNDAEYAAICIGSSAGAAKDAVDVLREKGEKVGLLKMRVFRPFPYQELCESLAHLKGIAVLERTLPQGSNGGPLFNELCTALYGQESRPTLLPFVYGIGGRDLGVQHIASVFSHLKNKIDASESMVPTETEVAFVNFQDNHIISFNQLLIELRLNDTTPGLTELEGLS